MPCSHEEPTSCHLEEGLQCDHVMSAQPGCHKLDVLSLHVGMHGSQRVIRPPIAKQAVQDLHVKRLRSLSFCHMRFLLCLHSQAAIGLSMPCEDVVWVRVIGHAAGTMDSRITQTGAMEPQAVLTWAAGPRASSLSRRTASSSGGGGPDCASRAGGVRTCTLASCKIVHDPGQPRHSSSPGTCKQPSGEASLHC